MTCDERRTKVVANVNRKVTRGSLQQRLKVGAGDGRPHVPSIRIVPDTCTKKIRGCGEPRKRIFEDLLGKAGPEAKRLCVKKTAED